MKIAYIDKRFHKKSIEFLSVGLSPARWRGIIAYHPALVGPGMALAPLSFNTKKERINEMET